MASETQQLNNRYREALRRILTPGGEPSWCKDYAMCDHVGCRASARHIEIARAALDLESVCWPLNR